MIFNILLYWARKNIIYIIAIGFSLFGMYLRIDVLAHHHLWSDEYFQLKPMSETLSFIEFLKILPEYEYASYLSGDHYLTYPFFRIFQYNKWALAIPHIISAAAGFYLLFLICKRHCKTALGYVVTFGVYCFHAGIIKHATEIRPYAVLPTLALAMFYFGEKIADNYESLGIKTKLAIGAFFVLVILFHAYGALIFFFPLAYIFIVRFMDGELQQRHKLIFRMVLIPICIAAPIWLFSVLGPHRIYQLTLSDGTISYYDVFEWFPSPIENLKGFFKDVLISLVGYDKSGSFSKQVYFLLLGGAIIAPFVPYKARFRHILFVVVTVFIPVALIFSKCLITIHPFLPRYYLWVIPLFAVYLGWIWDSMLVYFKDEIY